MKYLLKYIGGDVLIHQKNKVEGGGIDGYICDKIGIIKC